jgi:hypothetical protein
MQIFGFERSLSEPFGALTRYEPYLRLFLPIAGVLALVVLFFFNPAEARFFPVCPFHLLTDWHCPGCGTLRAVHQLLHGNFMKALSLNPLVMVVIPGLAYALLLRYSHHPLIQKLPRVHLRAIHIYGIAVLFIAYGILRNLPFPPFSMLAPS